MPSDGGSSRRASPPQACLNLGGRLGAVVQVTSANRKEIRWSYWTYSPYEIDTHETTWHFGFRMGGEMGIAAAAAFLMAEGANSSTHYYPVDFQAR